MTEKPIVTLEVEVPKVANFLRVKGSKVTISVADVYDSELLKLGLAYGDKLVERANEVRAARREETAVKP